MEKINHSPDGIKVNTHLQAGKKKEDPDYCANFCTAMLTNKDSPYYILDLNKCKSDCIMSTTI